MSLFLPEIVFPKTEIYNAIGNKDIKFCKSIKITDCLPNRNYHYIVRS
jgi:hypothetical protein